MDIMGPVESCGGFKAHGTKAVDDKVIGEPDPTIHFLPSQICANFTQFKYVPPKRDGIKM